ncbi:MAG: hypothetical protein DCC65_17585 [Planctomycetota bacterium]|nr:MAG: hypothetical protein DCC65_17585 [Planctomycetota bacterium]
MCLPTTPQCRNRQTDSRGAGGKIFANQRGAASQYGSRTLQRRQYRSFLSAGYRPAAFSLAISNANNGPRTETGSPSSVSMSVPDLIHPRRSEHPPKLDSRVSFWL